MDMLACSRRMTASLLTVALAAMSAGCTAAGNEPLAAGKSETTPAPLTQADLLPQNRPPIADLPVPVGFKLVESISRSYDWGGGRVVDHTFEGRAEKLELERFYLRQMPALGWMRANAQQVRGTSQLEFTNTHAERCSIDIADVAQPRTSTTGVRITLTVLPARNPPAKP